MKEKKKTFLIGILAVCMVVGTAVAVDHTPLFDIWFEAGQSNLSTNSSLGKAKPNDATVATVNGISIAKSSFERYKALSMAANEANKMIAEQQGLSQTEKQQIAKAPSDKELLQNLINKQIKLHEAENLGIIVSDTEVAAYFATLEEAMSLARPEAVELAESITRSYREGLGMTREEYREKVETEMAKEEILLSKLAAHIVTSKGISENATVEEKNAVLTEYFNNLVTNAVVEIK